MDAGTTILDDLENGVSAHETAWQLAMMTTEERSSFVADRVAAGSIQAGTRSTTSSTDAMAGANFQESRLVPQGPQWIHLSPDRPLAW